MTRDYRAMAAKSAKARSANAARRRANAARHADEDAIDRAVELAKVADQLAADAWPNAEPAL